MPIGKSEPHIYHLFDYKYKSQCCGLENIFQLEYHTLQDALHVSGDRYEDIICVHLSDIDDKTHTENSMKHH